MDPKPPLPSQVAQTLPHHRILRCNLLPVGQGRVQSRLVAGSQGLPASRGCCLTLHVDLLLESLKGQRVPKSEGAGHGVEEERVAPASAVGEAIGEDGSSRHKSEEPARPGAAFQTEEEMPSIEVSRAIGDLSQSCSRLTFGCAGGMFTSMWDLTLLLESHQEI